MDFENLRVVLNLKQILSNDDNLTSRGKAIEAVLIADESKGSEDPLSP